MLAGRAGRTVGFVAVVQSWRTPDARWLVDRVIDEPGIGYRIYTAEDLEGHRWMFGQPLSD
jgi:hypothetical protein